MNTMISGHHRIHAKTNKAKILRPVIQACVESSIEVERELASVCERLTKLEAIVRRIDAEQGMEEDDEGDAVVIRTKDNLGEVLEELGQLNKERIDELQKELARKDDAICDLERMAGECASGADDEDDCATVATEEGVKLMTEEPELRKCGTWSVDEEVCKGCIKTRTKSYKKMKKDEERKRRRAEQELKGEQVKLVKAEQALLKKKLNDLKRGRTSVDYSSEERRQEEMRRALRELATRNPGTSDKHFSINMFI